MVYYGLDYVAQIGSLFIMVLLGFMMIKVWTRLMSPIIERHSMVERVKMAIYDVELQKYCVENEVDYSKIDIDLGVCYKKSKGKLQDRLKEIEQGL